MLRLLRYVTYQGNFLTSPARIIFSRHLTKVISPLALRLLGHVTYHGNVLADAKIAETRHVRTDAKIAEACDVPGLFSHRR